MNRLEKKLIKKSISMVKDMDCYVIDKIEHASKILSYIGIFFVMILFFGAVLFFRNNSIIFIINLGLVAATLLLLFFIFIDRIKNSLTYIIDIKNSRSEDLFYNKISLYFYILDLLNDKDKIDFISYVNKMFSIDRELLNKYIEYKEQSVFNDRITEDSHLFNKLQIIDELFETIDIDYIKNQDIKDSEINNNFKNKTTNIILKEKMILADIYGNKYHTLFDFDRKESRVSNAKLIKESKKDIKIENL